jgi:hypothetical protein
MLAEAVERSDTDPPSVAIYLSISRSAAPVAGDLQRGRGPLERLGEPPKGSATGPIRRLASVTMRQSHGNYHGPAELIVDGEKLAEVTISLRGWV